MAAPHRPQALPGAPEAARDAAGAPARGAAPTPRAAILSPRRIYILPTASGIAFFAALVVMLLGSINYNNSLGFMLTFLLAGMAFLSMLHTVRNLSGLQVHAAPAEGVFAGGEARLRLCLQSRRQGPRPALEIHYAWPEPGAPGRWRLPGRRRSSGARLDLGLAGAGIHCADLAAPARRRGRLRVSRLTLATRYPLGLFRAWAPVRLELSCLVYPAPAGALPLPAAAPHAGPREARGGGAGQDDFAGFRGFVAGDPPRRVHWKSAARGQALQVKMFSGGHEVLRLAWGAAGPGAVEARLSQLARWVLEADRQHRSWSLELPGARLPAGAGEAHLRASLEALALHGEPRPEATSPS